LFEGLSLAKEAVQLDPTDGKSWLILGNAYFSVAFYSTHSGMMDFNYNICILQLGL
jgi:hypothetical protein